MTSEGPQSEAADHVQVHPLRSQLHAQTALLDALIHTLAERDEVAETGQANVLRVTLLMIQALGVSMHSILRLTEARDMAIRDAYGIARSASELAVNICYIAVGGDEVAQQADRHAMQKSYRDLYRVGEVGGIEFEVRSNRKAAPHEVPGLSEALAEFTGRKGQELTDWTPVKMSARIEAVAAVHSSAGLALSGSTVAIYRHASELLHGTYFGVVHFWSGSGLPATTREAFSARWDEHFIAIFTGVFFAVQAVIELYAKLFDNPEIATAQQRLMFAVNQHIRSEVAG